MPDSITWTRYREGPPYSHGWQAESGKYRLRLVAKIDPRLDVPGYEVVVVPLDTGGHSTLYVFDLAVDITTQ